VKSFGLVIVGAAMLWWIWKQSGQGATTAAASTNTILGAAGFTDGLSAAQAAGLSPS
jgi:hypothetical protein